jgi:hypothetical protein
MEREVFGRTNRTFPQIWLSLNLPPGASEAELRAYVSRAASLATPIDISCAPALFGAMLPRGVGAPLIQNSRLDLEYANGSGQAADMIQAHLIETLSSLQRSFLDFYFLRSKVALEEAQISGALEGLESARQQGYVGFFGLYVDNFAGSVGNWQFHDAFDVVSVAETLLSEDQETLRRMAKQRRCGFLLRTNHLDQEGPRQDTMLLTIKNGTDLDRLEMPA